MSASLAIASPRSTASTAGARSRSSTRAASSSPPASSTSTCTRSWRAWEESTSSPACSTASPPSSPRPTGSAGHRCRGNVCAMGWDGGNPTDDQLAAMKRALGEWLDAGAVGMAAGLEYQPGALSPVSELVELCKLVAATGGVYAPHQRGYWVRQERGCGESFDIGRQSGVKVHISHLAIDDTAARLLDEAQASGIDVSFDMYPYTAACTHLLMMLPEWAQAGGYEVSMHRIDDSEERARLRDETAARIAERGAITLSCVESGGELEGKQLGTLARETHKADVDCMFDLLSSHAGRALAVYHWPQSIPGEAIIKRSLAHPLYIGSTDGIY